MKSSHILLVEDNEADIFYTTEILEDIQMVNKISAVRDGKEALEFLNKIGDYANVDVPDLILLDINLPKKNGHEVLQYIKTSENLKHISVVMLSTSSTRTDIEQAHKNLANGYIIKPLRKHDINGIISAIEGAVFYSPATH